MSSLNTTNILEFDTFERDRFTSMPNANAKAAYRAAVERLTGSLPSWAVRGKPGRPRKDAQ